MLTKIKITNLQKIMNKIIIELILIILIFNFFLFLIILKQIKILKKSINDSQEKYFTSS